MSRAGSDRRKVWTGTLNAKALDPQPRGTVGLYDTTLRDGEQSVGVVLSPEDKLEIARALDAAGIDRIEAGFPRVSADDWRAVELVSAAGLRAEVWGFSRAVQADVEALVELGVPASVIESPISDAKLAALGVSREKMLDRIRSAVSFATEAGIKVAFFGVDSSRADLEFYRRAYDTAVEAGAQEVVVVDTIGIATPEAAAYLVGQTVDWLGGEIPVHWHGHDDFGLGTAAAVAAVQAGATWVQGTINGMGERAGNADLIEVALALEALYGIPDAPRPDAGADRSHSSSRSGPARRFPPGRRSPATRSSRASRARSRRSSTIRRRSSRTPPSSSARRAGSCSARRAASTRSGSPPSGSASTCPRSGARTLLAAVKELGRARRAASSPTTSSAALVAAETLRPVEAGRRAPVDCHVTGMGYSARVPMTCHRSRAPCDRAGLRDRRRRDRQPVRGSSGPGRRGERPDAAARARGCAQRPRTAGQRPQRLHAFVTASTDPAEIPPFDLGIVATKAPGPRGGGSDARGPLPRGDDHDDAQRARRRGDRPSARRLADHLRRHVHERHPARRHARRVHPRHRDVARAVRGHAVRERRGGRRADSGRGAEGRGAARSAARAVVEADLQRHGQLGRSAHRPAARPALRGRGARRPTSATSSTTSSTRARPSRPQPASSSTTTRGR